MRLVLVLLSLLLIVNAVEAGPSVLFVLEDSDQGLALRKVPIADQETKTFRVGQGFAAIDVILPISPGQSGNVVQRNQGGYEVLVRRDGDALHTAIRKDDGSSRDYPVVSLNDLATYDVRVNVTRGDGEKSLFVISGWDEVAEGDGPVIDLFGGAVPLEPGDVSLTVQTSLRGESTDLQGTTPLEFSEGLMFTRGLVPPGVDGDFIVDFGATGSVVVRWFLPRDTEIRDLKAVEYSDEGVRELDASLRAAGGNVDDFVGVATLPELHLGDITFEDAQVNVIEEMPEIAGRMVVGIIGGNLLQQAEVAVMDYKTPAAVTPLLRLSSESLHKGQEGIREIPFTLVQRHIFLSGSVDDVPVSFLFDTGARRSVVATEVVRKAGLSMIMGPRVILKGLDSNAIPIGVIHPLTVMIGDVSLKGIDLAVAELPVLVNMGLAENGGLLGADILQRYGKVEVDFRGKVIRLVP